MYSPQLMVMSTPQMRQMRSVFPRRRTGRSAASRCVAAMYSARNTADQTIRWARMYTGGTSASRFQNSGSTPHSR